MDYLYVVTMEEKCTLVSGTVKVWARSSNQAMVIAEEAHEGFRSLWAKSA